MVACGCGEEQIPWMLARFGMLGTAGFVLAALVLMTLVGWALASAIWLLRARGGAVAEETGASSGLAGFTWREDET
ncbi:hypothetical protein [Streptomyces capitiformicae]|uniref:Uncharacterized protein n=1 Tax=Streptomyces capitiformicae TaxID=2014920 RepID=A0A919L8D9_9ACTN|nr:hypothetical protein [Streptomyces capitiformicae]GHH86456.1 hypothetical protein GCM10017771_23610 [Streptomyces capitiformicae]